MLRTLTKKKKRHLKYFYKIAQNRARILAKLALENLEFGDKYVKIIRELRKKFKIKVPIKYCKRCYIPWIIGKTVDVRIRKGKIIYRCKRCGYVKRVPFKKA